MIWLSQNHADLGTVVAGSQVATLPAANVLNDHISKRWHTLSGVKSSNLVGDLGVARTVGAFAALGTNLTSAATFRLRLSLTDPTAQASLVYDSGTVSSHVITGYGTIYHWFTAVAARYYRYEPADTTVADHLEHGRIVLGPKWTPLLSNGQPNAPQFGHATGILDYSRLTESEGGQTYVALKPKRRISVLTLGWGAEDEMYANAFAAMRANGAGKDNLIIPNELASNARLHEQSIWGLIPEDGIQGGVVADAYKNYRVSITIVERL